MELSEQILQCAQEHYEKIVDMRRDLHMHPEIGFEVFRTAEIVNQTLTKLDIKVKTQIGKTGVVGDITVPNAKKTVALRADMDALPMQELSDVPYKSKVDGKAHMCGHDAHTSMLLGAATIISQLKDHLKANVRFIFQPNEENPPGGALEMIKDGALENVDEIFGIHVWPTLDHGKISVCPGPCLGQPDNFTIKIIGKGGHAAVPHKAIDPIYLGAQFITAVQSLVARCVDPLDSAVVSVTEFQAGSAHNIIPETAHLRGTIRTFKSEVQKMIKEKFISVLEGITRTHGANYELEYEEGYPVTFNHEESIVKVLRAAKSIVGKTNLVYPEAPVMGGEDFSYYVQKVPGCFTFLGVRNEERGIVRMVHDPRFDIEEKSMVFGMALHASLALTYE